MKTYKAMYRCRICGKAFCSGEETDERLARGCIIRIVSGIKQKCIAAPIMLLLHDCGEPYNGVGLADCIWYIAKEDETNAEETN